MTRFILIFFILSLVIAQPVYHISRKQNIEIRSAAADTTIAKKIMSAAERYRTQILEKLQFQTEQIVIIIIAPDEDEFNRITHNLIPEWGVAATLHDPPLIVLKSPRNDKNARYQLGKILFHEIAHFVLQQSVDNRLIPRWFHEGFAVVSANEMSFRRRRAVAQILYREEAVSLHQVNQLLKFYPAKAEVVYAQCGSAFGFFLKITNHEGPSKLTQVMRKGKDFGSAFQFSTGLTTKMFEQNWHDSGRSPFPFGWVVLYADEILWSLIPFLTILAFGIKKMRNRRILRQWEQEEINLTKKDLEIYEA